MTCSVACTGLDLVCRLTCGQCFVSQQSARSDEIFVAEITSPRPPTSRRPSCKGSFVDGRGTAPPVRICVRVIGRLSEPASFCAAVYPIVTKPSD